MTRKRNTGEEKRLAAEIETLREQIAGLRRRLRALVETQKRIELFRRRSDRDMKDKLNKKREAIVLHMHDEGLPIARIAESLGVTNKQAASYVRYHLRLRERRYEHEQYVSSIRLKMKQLPIDSPSIDVLNLSARAYNALSYAGLSTVSQVAERINSLGSIRNLGMQSRREIVEAIHAFQVENR